MSIVKAKNVQIGNDATATNNFTIMQPTTPNGTLEIRRGNADAPGALLCKINADGGVQTNTPTFRAVATANQTVTASNWTKLNLPTEQWDSHNWFDTTTSRFTPQIAGYYQFNGTSRANSGARYVISSIYKNGAEALRGVECNVGVQAAASDNMQSVVSDMIYMNGTTDYVELYVFTDLTTSQSGTGAFGNRFSGFLVRAA
jgi:hypothetical protein